MSDRATFGDFARAARGHLDDMPAQIPARPAPTGRPDTLTTASQVQQFTRSLRHALTVIDRYLADIATALGDATGLEPPDLLSPWARASIEARAALRDTAWQLRHASAERGDQPGPAPAGSPAQALDAAMAAIAAGRDLLHTYRGTGPRDSRPAESDWAPLAGSMTVSRALLTEVAGWARRIAAGGSRLAHARSASPGLAAQRRELSAACQSLRALAGAVERAQRREPVRVADVELLHAIPVNIPAPRRLPAGTETIPELCQGTAHSADRVRRAATRAVPAAAWSPAMSAESLSQAAAWATVISHHCEIVQHALAARAAGQGSAGLSERLTASAEAAGRARLAWLRAARAWSQVKTDSYRRAIAPATAEAADLALWTGRLAYADPAWTPDLGPSHATRPPGELAPTRDDLPGVLAAVHHASVTLNAIAAADHAQIHRAAQAGRLLVPVSSLPDYYDIPHPFTRAPASRVQPLLTAYHDAETASEAASQRIEVIAADIKAPTAILATARAAIEAEYHDHQPDDPRHGARTGTMPARVGDRPGPAERQLRHLGVTSPALLTRARALDKASGTLMHEATRTTPAQRPARHAAPTTSPGTTKPISDVYARNSSRSARSPARPVPERSLQAEPEP